MPSQEYFIQLTQPSYLYYAALCLGGITVVLVMLIYAYLYRKKKRFLLKHKIEEKLILCITTLLIAEDNSYDIEIVNDFKNELKKIFTRQYVIDQLIYIKKNLAGQAAEKVIDLYLLFNLRKDSIHKLHSSVWHKKAKGIYELYMMNQQDMLPEIARHSNSNNDFVRIESQTAIIGFEGFEGLKFLNNLTYPITEWQQIKLLEQLQLLDQGELADLPMWLASENRYVVQFALKLADIYQKMDVHDEVVQCLYTQEEKNRNQAIKTLGRIAQSNTAEILMQQYDKETDMNKKEILRQLAAIGDDDVIPFLLKKMRNEDDTLKLETARAIALCSTEGVDIFTTLGLENSETAIVQHIKQELR